MPFTEMVVMIAMFAALCLGAIHLMRLVGTGILHRTVRKAIDKDAQAAEPLLARLSAAPEPTTDDDRTAILLIAFGVAMVAASLIIGDPSWMNYGIAGAI